MHHKTSWRKEWTKQTQWMYDSSSSLPPPMPLSFYIWHITKYVLQMIKFSRQNYSKASEMYIQSTCTSSKRPWHVRMQSSKAIRKLCCVLLLFSTSLLLRKWKFCSILIISSLWKRYYYTCCHVLGSYVEFQEYVLVVFVLAIIYFVIFTI